MNFMRFQTQSGSRDCFPACFCNAMHYFGIEITPALRNRLDAFTCGMESCTIHENEERLERYERSIHKFMAEWAWAQRCRENAEGMYTKPETWARGLLEKGIALELRNGPIEQQSLLMAGLSRGSVVLCEVWVLPPDIPDSESRHFILIIKAKSGALLAHDPLLIHSGMRFGSDAIRHGTDECGANFEIACEYFFSEQTGPLKPKPNPYQTGYGYKFMLVARR